VIRWVQTLYTFFEYAYNLLQFPQWIRGILGEALPSGLDHRRGRHPNGVQFTRVRSEEGQPASSSSVLASGAAPRQCRRAALAQQ
jgi:hypothetical protein